MGKTATATQPFSITDGTETSVFEAQSIEVAIAEYAQSYGFNEPGDVECRVIETGETFTVRSDDGRRGYLVTE